MKKLYIFDFRGKDKISFLKEMEMLWDIFNKEMNTGKVIKGFKCIAGEPIEIRYLLTEGENE